MDNNHNNAFSMIADVDGDFVEMSREDMPTQVPLLVTRNIVPYPGIVTTIFVARHSSLTLVREYEKNKGFIAIAIIIVGSVESPVQIKNRDPVSRQRYRAVVCRRKVAEIYIRAC